MAPSCCRSGTWDWLLKKGENFHVVDFNAHFLEMIARSWKIQSPRLGARDFIRPNVKNITSCYKTLPKAFCGGKQPCCSALGPINMPAAELRSKGNEATGFLTRITHTPGLETREPRGLLGPRASQQLDMPSGWGKASSPAAATRTIRFSAKLTPGNKKHSPAAERTCSRICSPCA